MDNQQRGGGPASGIHVVAKPIGPMCNLDCEYCFYLEKRCLFPRTESYRMPDGVLSALVTNYINAQPTRMVEFVWQGGEPTLLGIDFFRRVVDLQRPFRQRKVITNSLQTNGTLLTDEWCDFLKAHGFMVGISLDGPREIHDRYRRDPSGGGTFDRVMRGLQLLQKHAVPYHVLACVARETATRPLDGYCFLRAVGVEFVQFTPVVERLPDEETRAAGLRLGGPPSLKDRPEIAKATSWTVVPEDYGDFLIAVYEEWIRHDVGKVFVTNFEWALDAWLGNPPPVCVHATQCGRSPVIEHNGDVYACDHCVYPRYRVGNVVTDSLQAMVAGPLQSGFGAAKETALPRSCTECEVLTACRGGCPKHRFAESEHGEPGLHYLCGGYKKFFLHIRKYLRAMTTLLEHGLPASYVMDAAKGPLAIRLDGK